MTGFKGNPKRCSLTIKRCLRGVFGSVRQAKRMLGSSFGKSILYWRREKVAKFGGSPFPENSGSGSFENGNGGNFPGPSIPSGIPGGIPSMPSLDDLNGPDNQQQPVSAEKLIPPSYLFRFSTPIFMRDKIWKKGGMSLEPRYQMANLGSLDTAEDGPVETRVAWNADGLTLQFNVSGKKMRPHCRLTDLEQSDSVEIFVDTRNTKTVHRATRFCHRFMFFPTGGGDEKKDAHGTMLKIHLARGEPTCMGQFRPNVHCKIKRDGYTLTCHLHKDHLEGWQPGEQAEIGLFFLVRDQELGVHCLTYDHQLPVTEDPSLWPTVFLSRQTGV